LGGENLGKLFGEKVASIQLTAFLIRSIKYFILCLNNIWTYISVTVIIKIWTSSPCIQRHLENRWFETWL